MLDESHQSYDEFIRDTIREQSREQIERQVKKSIWVTFQKEGIHKYPDAPDEVDFLRYPHRHIFKFKVQIEVFHGDRDIEFFIFKRWLESLYAGGTLELDYKSCEMIADDLYNEISTKYPGRFVEIDVAEDGENGCSIYYPKP